MLIKKMETMNLKLFLCLLVVKVSFALKPSIVTLDPPKPSELALMARYVVNTVDWITLATISTIELVEGYPFVSLESMSDGPLGQGKGTPYFYLTDLDFCAIDAKKDNRISIIASLAETTYCKQVKLDPQDPRCSRVMLTGRLTRVASNTTEHDFAINALYDRHPVMKSWPADHHFYVATIIIQQIYLFDSFGGAHNININDYFNANEDTSFNEIVVNRI